MHKNAVELIYKMLFFKETAQFLEIFMYISQKKQHISPKSAIF